MTLDGYVAEAGRALGEGRSLFGPAAVGGRFASTPSLDDAGKLVGGGAADSQEQWKGGAGSGYRDQAAGTVRALDATSGADKGAGAGVEEGGAQARQGRSGADGIVDDARRGVAAIAPSTGTRAGKTEMVEHLQERLLAMRGRLIRSEQNAMRIAQQIRGAGAGYRGGGMGGGGVPMMGGGMSPAGMGGSSGGGGFSLPNFGSLINAGRTNRTNATPTGDNRLRQAPMGSGGSAAAQQAVRAAMTKLGKPYLWGGTGPNGFDCSGLIQWSYAQAGITIGRDTRAQLSGGMDVAPGDVTGGDAIFPKNSWGRDGKPGPAHVLMAISPTQCIEASTEGVPIKISPMPSSFVARRFVA
ncbi:C40 family peptidase [Mycobacteroides abscessus]|uniref:C40 family peptidase n=1 Tax=Mycobacteroides abscessus TaxID=36809 RepID=UPI001F1FBABD|nr:NlpC/P60 family protein [Mycobacteroides abscessus]